MSAKPLKPELGKLYLTRDDEHLVRVISLIGKWSKKHPVVGEFYEIKGKKRIPVEGLFQKYEHWGKEGFYLDKGVESSLDLMAEIKDEK